MGEAEAALKMRAIIERIAKKKRIVLGVNMGAGVVYYCGEHGCGRTGI